MKILLQSLVFGLVCAKEPQTEQDSSQVPGMGWSWSRTCVCVCFVFRVNEKCTEMYTKGRKIAHNVYEGNYAGKNELHFVHVSKNALILYNINVDEEGKKTMIMELIGKGNTAEEQDFKKFKELTRKKGIPEENIMNIIKTDDCPRQ
uniref:Lipocalin/cytosolic fatty-acid binding domain-containing protein n=1 Tax=Sus scrofa TaxID=9823 RepID=A0A8D0VY62_PIG